MSDIYVEVYYFHIHIMNIHASQSSINSQIGTWNMGSIFVGEVSVSLHLYVIPFPVKSYTSTYITLFKSTKVEIQKIIGFCWLNGW